MFPGSASKGCIKMLSDQSCSGELSRCYHDVAFEEIEEGEWIPEDIQDTPGPIGREPVEGDCLTYLISKVANQFNFVIIL